MSFTEQGFLNGHGVDENINEALTHDIVYTAIWSMHILKRLANITVWDVSDVIDITTGGIAVASTLALRLGLANKSINGIDVYKYISYLRKTVRNNAVGDFQESYGPKVIATLRTLYAMVRKRGYPLPKAVDPFHIPGILVESIIEADIIMQLLDEGLPQAWLMKRLSRRAPWIWKPNLGPEPEAILVKDLASIYSEGKASLCTLAMVENPYERLDPSTCKYKLPVGRRPSVLLKRPQRVFPKVSSPV